MKLKRMVKNLKFHLKIARMVRQWDLLWNVRNSKTTENLPMQNNSRYLKGNINKSPF
jgi:hypothetical protein